MPKRINKKDHFIENCAFLDEIFNTVYDAPDLKNAFILFIKSYVSNSSNDALCDIWLLKKGRNIKLCARTSAGQVEMYSLKKTRKKIQKIVDQTIDEFLDTVVEYPGIKKYLGHVVCSKAIFLSKAVSIEHARCPIQMSADEFLRYLSIKQNDPVIDVWKCACGYMTFDRGNALRHNLKKGTHECQRHESIYTITKTENIPSKWDESIFDTIVSCVEDVCPRVSYVLEDLDLLNTLASEVTFGGLLIRYLKKFACAPECPPRFRCMRKIDKDSIYVLHSTGPILYKRRSFNTSRCELSRLLRELCTSFVSFSSSLNISISRQKNKLPGWAIRAACHMNNVIFDEGFDPKSMHLQDIVLECLDS